jgi:hypothetical protein
MNNKYIEWLTDRYFALVILHMSNKNNMELVRDIRYLKMCLEDNNIEVKMGC